MVLKQSGIALLSLVIVLVLAITAYYFSSISLNEARVKEEEKISQVLKRAKQALIDYAVINWRTVGNGGKLAKLPCPDSTVSINEGAQANNCGSAYANAIGLFPWRTVGVDVPKEAGGACIIYIVSPAYKSNPAAALNPDSFGQLQIVDRNGVIIQGNTPENRPVAVLIAPGPTLPGQTRTYDSNSICGNDADNYTAYLDDDGTTDNSAIDDSIENVIDTFVNRYPGSDQGINPLNDRLLTLTHNELWSAMQSTVESAEFTDLMTDLTEAMALCVAEFGKNNGNHLPMPAALDLNGGEYRQDAAYTDSSDFTAGFSGRFPYDISNAKARLAGSDENRLFDNAYCDGLITSTLAQNVNFTDDAGGDNGAYYDLWRNWKDHFFYAISKDFNPDITTPACASDCIELPAGNQRAGAVFFSGLKTGGITRYQPPFDPDEKAIPSNYLEDGNDAFFPDNAGDQIYNSSTGNDIIFCIETNMSVEAC